MGMQWYLGKLEDLEIREDLDSILPDGGYNRRDVAGHLRMLQIDIKRRIDQGKRGLISPIVVLPEPIEDGKWVIFKGHCRYKAIRMLVEKHGKEYDEVLYCIRDWLEGKTNEELYEEILNREFHGRKFMYGTWKWVKILMDYNRNLIDPYITEMTAEEAIEFIRKYIRFRDPLGPGKFLKAVKLWLWIEDMKTRYKEGSTPAFQRRFEQLEYNLNSNPDLNEKAIGMWSAWGRMNTLEKWKTFKNRNIEAWCIPGNKERKRAEMTVEQIDEEAGILPEWRLNKDLNLLPLAVGRWTGTLTGHIVEEADEHFTIIGEPGIKPRKVSKKYHNKMTPEEYEELKAKMEEKERNKTDLEFWIENRGREGWK